MKYYIIYKKATNLGFLSVTTITSAVEHFCVVEKKEVAEDFCNRNPNVFSYEEVEIKEQNQ